MTPLRPASGRTRNLAFDQVKHCYFYDVVGAAGHYSNLSQQLICLQGPANLTPESHTTTERAALKQRQRRLKGPEIQQLAHDYREGTERPSQPCWNEKDYLVDIACFEIMPWPGLHACTSPERP